MKLLQVVTVFYFLTVYSLYGKFFHKYALNKRYSISLRALLYCDVIYKQR